MNSIFAINMTINICSLFFFLFLVIVYFRKNARNSLKNRIFHIMCYLGFIEFILGIAKSLLLKYYLKNILIIGLQKIYYLCFFVIILLWIYYVLILTIEKNKKKADFVRNHIGEIRILLFLLIVSFGIVDIVLPLNIIFDNFGRVIYLDGGIIPVLGVVSAFLTILPIPFIIVNRKSIIFRKLLPYLITIILEIITLLTHNYFKELIIIPFIITILYYFIYYRLENPDIVIVRKFKRMSERINIFKEQYYFLFNMSTELRNLLNEISHNKDDGLGKKKTINKRKLERLLSDFINDSCGEVVLKKTYKDDNYEILSFDDNDQSDEMLITKEIYSLNELQEVLKDDNLPKW